MKCDDFEARIHQRLDERCSPRDDRHLLDHASECPTCADVLETYSNVVRQLGHWQPPPLDDDFSRRTVQAALRDSDRLATTPLSKEPLHRSGRSSRSMFRPRFAYQALVLSACVLLIVASAPLWLPSVDTDGPVTQTAVSEPDRIQPMNGLGESSPRQLSDPRALGPAAIATGDWRIVWTQWSTALQSEPLEPLDTWTKGIRPLTASLHTAWLSLRTSFPLYEQRPQHVADEVSTSS